MATVVPRRSCFEALHSPAFEAALPGLIAYAARCLRRADWAEGRDTLPSAFQAEEVVDEAVACCIEGGRSWPEGLDFEAFLRGVIRSLVSNERRDAERWPTATLEAIAETAAPSSRRDDRIAARRLLGLIEPAVENDFEMRALFAVILEGAVKRADQATALGWTPQRVTAVCERMNRRLAALDLCDGDEDERAPRDRSPREAATPRRKPRRGPAR
jgi:DNA-directed RNA polymerase specialized sigma24 family protein